MERKDVKEAFRLLNKSIIRVEQPDIQLEDEEGMGAEPDALETENASQDAPPAQPPSEEPKRTKLSYEEYKKMANLLACYMRHKEEVCSEDEDPGLRRSELVSWYLKEVEAEIETESELIEKKTVIEKVIYRLVNHVSISFSMLV